MKKIMLIKTVLFLSLFLALNNYAQEQYKINVVMLGIGAHNPTFDEKQFPDLKYYYTPELISQAKVGKTGKALVNLFGDNTREIFEGEPAHLAKWWDEKNLKNYAVLFDKNGVGAWQGYLNLDEDDILDSDAEGGDHESLKDILEQLIEDNENIELDVDKNKDDFDYGDDESLLEREMPDFNVESINKETKSIKNLVKSDKPTLLIIFQIPKDVDLNAQKKMETEKSVGGFLGNVAQTTAKQTWLGVMQKIEFSVFNKDIKIYDDPDE